MRIREAPAKFGFVLAGIIIGTLIAIVLGMFSLTAGYVWWIFAAVGLLALCARFFRGSDEGDRPRTWWQVAATSRASVAVGVVYGVMAVTAFVNTFTTPLGALSAGGAVVLAAAAAVCVYSAMRLSKQRTRTTP
jgi:hypothetical protein